MNCFNGPMYRFNPFMKGLEFDTAPRLADIISATPKNCHLYWWRVSDVTAASVKFATHSSASRQNDTASRIPQALKTDHRFSIDQF